MIDTEGYSCAIRDVVWRIVDRYGKVVEGEKSHYDYESARHRADEMNEDVIARRLADMIARR